MLMCSWATAYSPEGHGWAAPPCLAVRHSKPVCMPSYTPSCRAGQTSLVLCQPSDSPAHTSASAVHGLV